MAVATNHVELIQHIRTDKCRVSKVEDFQTRRDVNSDTISEEYLVLYADGSKLVIHIHNDIGEDSYKIHVKADSYGRSLFSLGTDWSKFVRLVGLGIPFG